MPGRGIEGLPSALCQPIKTVAADLAALEPAVCREPRHRRAHHAAVDVECLEKFQQRAEPDRAAARHDGVAEHGDDDRAGARGFALELFDDSGERLRHESTHTAFFGFTKTPALFLLPRPALAGSRRAKPALRGSG